jgi:hypothetical protein
MSRVTQRELDSIRDAQLDFLPDTILQTKRKFYDGDNGFERQPYLSNIASRFTPGFGRWTIIADRFQGITAFTVTVPWDTDIIAGDELIDDESRTFEVRDSRSPSTYQTAKQLLVDLITDG